METLPTTTAAPILEMHDVSVGALRDQDNIVLEAVNWSVRAGEFWVVAGMHGSGKSDLLLLAGGIMPPQSGTYQLFGNPMPIYRDDLLAERLRLGLVFDTGQLLHQLTIKENVALPLRYHHNLHWQEVEERVNAMLELTGLTSLANQLAGNVGRHWQKRAGLARALMLEPEVLLVNMPLGGLDLRHISWSMNFLEKLSRGQSFIKDRSTTIIVTAEDLRPWQNRNCHFAILKEKRFMPLGYCPNLNNHSEQLVKELLAEELLSET